MKVYFDTNVYDRISRSGQDVSVLSLIRSRRARVLASDDNLLELLAITDEAARVERIRTLTTVASEFEQTPESWRHALEVRREVNRCRRRWIRPRPELDEARQFLDGHIRRWTDARRLKLPPPHAFAAYRRVAQAGAKQAREFQKFHRKSRLENDVRHILATADPALPQVPVDLGNPELFWRATCMTIWHSAIEVRHPAMRDYADWLSPYLKDHSFGDPTYPRFWLEEVDPLHVPRNRVASLCSFYQTDESIRLSNAQDQLHACYVLDVDVFVTGDGGLFRTLEQIRADHLRSAATLIHLDPKEDVAEQLASALSR